MVLGGRQGHIGHAQLINEPALGNPIRLAADPAAHAAIVHVDDVAELFFKLATADQITHAAYLAGGHVVGYEELAGIVRKFVPAADITFEAPPERGAEYGFGLSFDYDHGRAKAEFGYNLPPLADRVLDSMNGTRAMSDLPQLASPA